MNIYDLQDMYREEQKNVRNNKQNILDIIKHHGPITSREIIIGSNISSTTVYRILRELVYDNIITSKYNLIQTMSGVKNIREYSLVKHTKRKTYIKFIDVSNKYNRKTNTFEVRAISDNYLLGHIQWDTGWRRYVFCNVLEPCKFSSGCHKDITEFIDKLMGDRKK